MFRQAIYNLRSQPLIGVISVIGTALCLMLVTLITYLSFGMPDVSPNSHGRRLLYDYNIALAKDGNIRMMSALSQGAIDRLYSGLSTIDCVAQTGFYETTDIETDGSELIIADCRKADANYWRVYDHKLLAGSVFTPAEVERGDKVAVITRSVAGQLFGATDPIGKTVRIGRAPYTVKGVVADVSPAFGYAYSQIWVPFEPVAAAAVDKPRGMTGSRIAILMARPGVDAAIVQAEARSRIPAFQKELDAMGGWSRHYADIFPIAADKLDGYQNHGFDGDPDVDRQLGFILTIIFLIVPAINLSGMTRGSLARRRHKIGVRRAFGARRGSIFLSLLAENFIVTLIGGIIGLVLCLAALSLFASSLIDPSGWETPVVSMSLPLSVLFNWRIFGLALLFCFILNFLSTGLPALRASRVNPVDALKG